MNALHLRDISCYNFTFTAHSKFVLDESLLSTRQFRIDLLVAVPRSITQLQHALFSSFLTKRYGLAQPNLKPVTTSSVATMETLNLEDTPQHGGPQGGAPQTAPVLGQPPQQSQQLPPQMFTTAAQLLDMTDKKLMVALRDGRKLVGVLRSWDQFANLVFQGTVERIFIPPTSPENPGLFADKPRGIFIVRGENVLLLGEIDLDTDDDVPRGYEQADLKVVEKLEKEMKRNIARNDKGKLKKLAELGFEGENSGEVLL
ncbi:hypothetical protein BJ878DRAFT_4221, partial [Calycina marina]